MSDPYQTAGDIRRAVRLSVNLAPDVAAALRDLSARSDVNLTEGVRRAIATWKLIADANDQGDRVMIVTGTGDEATYREVILL